MHTLHCITLQYTTTDETVYSGMHSIVLYCVISQYITLQYITVPYFTLPYVYVYKHAIMTPEMTGTSPTCCTDCGPKSLRESKAASTRPWIRGLDWCTSCIELIEIIISKDIPYHEYTSVCVRVCVQNKVIHI